MISAVEINSKFSMIEPSFVDKPKKDMPIQALEKALENVKRRKGMRERLRASVCTVGNQIGLLNQGKLDSDKHIARSSLGFTTRVGGGGASSMNSRAKRLSTAF